MRHNVFVLTFVLNLTQIFSVNFGVKAVKVSGTTRQRSRDWLLRNCFPLSSSIFYHYFHVIHKNQVDNLIFDCVREKFFS